MLGEERVPMGDDRVNAFGDGFIVEIGVCDGGKQAREHNGIHFRNAIDINVRASDDFGDALKRIDEKILKVGNGRVFTADTAYVTRDTAGGLLALIAIHTHIDSS